MDATAKLATSLRSIWVKTALGCLHVRTNNFAPGTEISTVLLVHGLVISSRYMMPIARQLAPWGRVYAVDLPGYGESEKPGRAPSVASGGGGKSFVRAWRRPLEVAT
jgi:pimeloyl-ACP methyl ester carboxylesterase